MFFSSWKVKSSSVEVLMVDYQNPQHQKDLISLMETYSHDLMGGGETLPAYTRSNLIESLSLIPGAFSLLAYEKRQAIGLTNCFQGFSTFLCRPLINIHDVIVLDGYRGRGICHKLLKEVETIAQQRGCCKLTLEVLQGNKSAKKAYAKFGFKGYELDPNLGHALFWDKIL